MFQYIAKIIRIVDGDTLKLDIDLGFRCHIFETVRLARIDTPETVNYGLEGVIDPAMQFVQTMCPEGSMCVVEIKRAEKYGRWLAEVFYLTGESDPLKILADPHVLNDDLCRAGFATRYDGGQK